MPHREKTLPRSKKPLPDGPSFKLFPKLPTQIRALIWELTLVPRIVEVHRSHGCSVRPLVNDPTALQVCRDSRAAVITLYPLCFGTFWFPPRTRVKFQIDIAYLDYAIINEVGYFFAFLGELELTHQRFLAIDMSLLVDNNFLSCGDNGEYQEEFLAGFQRAVDALTGLEQLIEVHDVRVWAEHCTWNIDKDADDDSRGEGEIQFFKKLPAALLKPELQINPNLPDLCEHFDDWGIKNRKVGFAMRKSWVITSSNAEDSPGMWSGHREFRFGISGGRFTTAAANS